MGWFNATWPFATLSLSAESISLKVFSTMYAVKKEEVSRLEFFRGWLSSGIKIVHSGAGLPSHTVFWSFSPHEVLAAAKTLGFQTKEEEPNQTTTANDLHAD